MIAHFLVFSHLGFGLSSSLRDFQSSHPLAQEDRIRGQIMDIKMEHVNLYPGRGGPISAPESSQNKTKSAWRIWPKGQIPYWMSPDFNEIDRATIANSISYIEQNTCL